MGGCRQNKITPYFCEVVPRVSVLLPTSRLLWRYPVFRWFLIFHAAPADCRTWVPLFFHLLLHHTKEDKSNAQRTNPTQVTALWLAIPPSPMHSSSTIFGTSNSTNLTSTILTRPVFQMLHIPWSSTTGNYLFISITTPYDRKSLTLLAFMLNALTSTTRLFVQRPPWTSP